ncbi:Dynein heavy chain 7, axonemal, partial [Rhizophlyctis rosea]
MMQRYYYYITNGIDTHHVADMEDQWLYNVLKLLPKGLKGRHQASLGVLSGEMRDDYHMSVKKAIVDFVLKDPRDKNDYGGNEKTGQENFVSIRQSTPMWHHAYNTSHDIISSNLFIINPTIVGILDLWDRFKGMRLFDMESIVGKGGSFDLKAFKSMFLGRLEKAGERLMTSWYPATLNIFYQSSKRSEWSLIPTSRMEPFFRTITCILGDQLRHIVRESLRDFCTLFDGNPTTIPKTYPTGSGVSFSVRLVLEDQKYKFDPPLSEIQTTVEQLFDALLTAADRIPKIETQLFSTGQSSLTTTRAGMMNVKPEQCIRVAFEGTYPGIVRGLREGLRKG